MKILVLVLLSGLLTACGGGGGGATTVTTPTSLIASHVTSPVIGGSSCVNTVNVDAEFGISLNWALPLNEPTWACSIVSSSNGYPVVNGSESMRFENRPGDCPGMSPDANFPTGWSDCQNDRSRNEVEEPVSQSTSNGHIISYSYKIYIPTQERFRPDGNNLLVLSQIRYSTSTGSNPSGALGYLIAMPNNKLGIRIHDAWTWNSVGDVPASIGNIYDRWISVKWEIKATDQNDGYLKVWLDDVLITSMVNRATLPVNDGVIHIKYGIYNSFKSSATEAYANQVMYFDEFTKTVR